MPIENALGAVDQEKKIDVEEGRESVVVPGGEEER
jgi:hypothetical protein